MAILSDDELQQWIEGETRAGALQPPFEAGFFPIEADLEDFWEIASREYESPTGRVYKKHRSYSHRPDWLNDTKFIKIFFYYFGIKKENSSIFSRIFSAELEKISGDWQSKVREWIDISRNYSLQEIPRYSDDFNSANPNAADWDIASHIVVFFDSDNWEYIEGEFQGQLRNLSLHFSTDNRNERNHAFFDARTENLVSGENLLVVDNHHVCARSSRRRRRQTGDVPDDYKFDIYYKIAVDDGSGDYLIMIIDPSGRNTGP